MANTRPTTGKVFSTNQGLGDTVFFACLLHGYNTHQNTAACATILVRQRASPTTGLVLMAKTKKSQKRRIFRGLSVKLPWPVLVVLTTLTLATTAHFVLASNNQPVSRITVDTDPNFHVKTLVTQFFEDNNAAEMIPIINCESGFRQYDAEGELLRNHEGSSAIGVAQILGSQHPDPKVIRRYNKKFDMDLTVDSFDITTLEGNLGYALVLYKVRGVRDWECSKRFRFQ